MGPTFFDTNVLVYATLDQDVAKKRIAASLIMDAVASQSFVISSQVLKEYVNILVRKSDAAAAENPSRAPCLRAVVLCRVACRGEKPCAQMRWRAESRLRSNLRDRQRRRGQKPFCRRQSHVHEMP